MKAHSQIIGYLRGLPSLEDWSEILTMLERAAAKDPASWRLPLIACQAVGGAAEQALPVAAAVGCLQIAIILIDDMLDADPRGLFHQIGMPETANLAAAFQAAGLEAAFAGSALDESKLAAVQSLNQMMLVTARGQQMDIETLVDEGAYWELIRTKSSPYFAAAMRAGALLGGASAETAAGLGQFGAIYGEIIQIQDDLQDTMATPANPDWTQGRSPLPILYAQTVEHSQRERFMQLRTAVTDLNLLAEAQTILIQSGAVSFCIDQILQRQQQCRELVANLPLADAGKLYELLERLVKPVEALLVSEVAESAAISTDS